MSVPTFDVWGVGVAQHRHEPSETNQRRRVVQGDSAAASLMGVA